ncbi:hypothetical protein DFH09DRAFT_1375288 [Mycena vulgaris]|nr:hypothetical protein DFH09DRAFT_1375288 [Mycena vulgaris]
MFLPLFNFLLMQRITFFLGIALFSGLPPLVTALISLSCPTTDVLQNASIDCQWTTSLSTDPETFNLVVQYSNLGSAFGQSNLVRNVTRGGKTSGTISNIQNAGTLGLHRLAVFVAPFEASSVSPGFQVVASLGSTIASSTSNSPTNLGVPTCTHAPARPSSTTRSTTIIVIVVICAALALASLVAAVVFLRRKKARADLDLLGGEPFLAWGQNANGLESRTAGSGSAPIVAPRRTKPQMRGPRLQDQIPPPAYLSL